MLQDSERGAQGAWCFLAMGLLVSTCVSCNRTQDAESGSDSARSQRRTDPPEVRTEDKVDSMLTLRSEAFQQAGEIPAKYTCQGNDVSPPLSWSGVPTDAKSLALIVDDPDSPDPAAPKRVWVHWVLFNIPPSVSALPEAVKNLPSPAHPGVNDWQRALYGGPCPPIGRHRYFFKLYALDVLLALESPTKVDLETAMRGHILASTELMGTYQKQ